MTLSPIDSLSFNTFGYPDMFGMYPYALSNSGAPSIWSYNTQAFYPYYDYQSNYYNAGDIYYGQNYNFDYYSTPYYLTQPSPAYPVFGFFNTQAATNNSDYSISKLNDYSFGSLTRNPKQQVLNNDKSISLNLSDKELDRLGFNTPNLKMRWKHLKPEFQKALIKLTRYAESKGIKISYGRRSTWRSAQDQIDMKKERGSFAAKPGHSPHEKGIAVDITTTSVNGNKRSNRENQALLGAYWESLGYRWGGHFKNFAREPWHFDLKPTRS